MWNFAPDTQANPTNEAISGIRRYQPLTFPARRYLLKALSMFPVRSWQALTLPCNPVCPAMWRDANRFDEPLDAVHATAFPYTFPISCALRLARRRRVPFLLTPFLHLGDPDNPANHIRRQYTQPVLRWLLREADTVFVQTESERRATVQLGVDSARVVLQGLGVDFEECTGGDRLAARRRWGLRDDERVIGHLANLSHEKGTVDLLQSPVPDRIVLAGPSMPNFERYWRDYPHKHRVIRLGVLDDDGKRDFFAGIDLFCLPSRTDSFGLVLLEAWANAKPVVVYRAGGPADLVRDGYDGVVSRCDPESLAVAIRRVTPQMGVRGQERARHDFRWSDKLAMVRDVIHRGSLHV